MSHLGFQKKSQNIDKKLVQFTNKQLEQINEEDSKCNSSFFQQSCLDASINSVHINLNKP